MRALPATLSLTLSHREGLYRFLSNHIDKVTDEKLNETVGILHERFGRALKKLSE